MTTNLKRNPAAGFTLIELLVVISIIGLLSSVVLAALNSAREKGRIAAGLTFDSHTYQAFGDTIVGRWDLNEGSGITARDSSGSGHDGTLHNSPVWVNDSPNSVGKNSLDFNGSTQYVDVQPSQDFVITTEGAMSIWVKPTTDATDDLVDIFTKGGPPWKNNDYSIFYYRDRFYGTIADGTDVAITHYLGIPAGPHSKVISLNKWYHVLFTWDTVKQKASLYLDGVLQQTITTAIVPEAVASGLTIGRDDTYNGYYFPGRLYGAKLFKSGLTLAQAQELYEKEKAAFLAQK